MTKSKNSNSYTLRIRIAIKYNLKEKLVNLKFQEVQLQKPKECTQE